VTQQQPELDTVARAILDASHYMTLGTADAAGRPLRSRGGPATPGRKHPPVAGNPLSARRPGR
jgi:hypothetical protein